MGDVVQMNSYREDMTGVGSKSATYSSDLGNTATGANVINQSENSSTTLADSDEVASVTPQRDSLIPIELAVGSADRNFCLTRMAKYDVCAIHIRMVKDDPDALVYLMSVNDAIAELQRCSGTQFDAGIVEVFVDICRESELDSKLVGIECLRPRTTVQSEATATEQKKSHSAG